MKPKKCFMCNKEFENINQLASHLEEHHSNVIPAGWSGGKYYFNYVHGRTHGKCVVCGSKTKFNENTFKPFRLCPNPQCKLKMRENAKNNMIKKYGKETLLNDPEFQKNKMLANRKIAKDYKWSNGKTMRVIGSFEYDFARFCDVFLDMEYEDVIMPAPFVIEYEYDGNKHFYIPDCYIQSLNLVVEIKDGGDNPNTHPKIMAIDKVKEKIKDKAIRGTNKYNYIKIENKQYADFIEMIREIKNTDILPSSPKYKTISMDNHHIVINEDVTDKLDYVFKPKIVRYRKTRESDIAKYGIITATLNKYVYNNESNMLEKNDSLYVDTIFTVNDSMNMDIFTDSNLDIFLNRKVITDFDSSLILNPIYFVYEIYRTLTGEECNILNISCNNLSFNKLDNIDNVLSEEYVEVIPGYIFEHTSLDEVYNEYTSIDSNKTKQTYLNLLENTVYHKSFTEINEEFTDKFPQLSKFIIENNLPEESLCEGFITQSVPIGVNGADKTSVNIKTRQFKVKISKDNFNLIVNNNYNDYHKLYQESKKLLPMYIKHNNLDGTKYELAKLHFLTTICDEYIHKSDDTIFKFNKDKSKYISLKSFIVPTFNKYLDELMAIDNSFNFTQYYNETEFSTVDIDINFNFQLLKKFHKLFEK